MKFIPSSWLRQEGATRKAEVAEVVPVKDSNLEWATYVHMIASVGGKHPDHTFEKPHLWELEGGKVFLVSKDLADMLIINGWATGELSREYSTDEKEQIRSKTQTITPGQFPTDMKEASDG